MTTHQILHDPNWAKSHLGEAIALYHSHDLNALASLKPFLFIGGVHGDEPEGVYLAESLLKAIPAQPKLHPWCLITCINPDGFKNCQRVNGRGVDLNRNFPTRDWQANEPEQRYYSGPSAASELETQAVIQIIDQIKPKVIIHFHSWKPCIVYTGEPGKTYAKSLASEEYPSKADIGYPTPGSLGQYGWLECKTPVICLEEQEGTGREEVWQHFGTKLLSLLHDTDTDIGSHS